MIDALIIFAVLIVLLFARLPVGFAMASVGIVGFAYYVGWTGTFAMIGRIAFDTPQRAESVSYTHLTLPTNREV